MDISEVARRSGVPASTLRFYEEKAADRLDRQAWPASSVRPGRTGAAGADRARARRRLLAGRDRPHVRPDGRPRIDRRMLAAKAEELDRTIRQLQAMRDGLRHAAACRAPSHMECPTFRRLLQAAASGQLGGRGNKKINR